MATIEQAPRIRWGRTFTGGLLLELLLIVVSGYFYGTDQVDALPAFVLPATAAAAIIAGWWVGRRVDRPVLHGALAGAAAIVIYFLLAGAGYLAAPEEVDVTMALSPLYLSSHAVKVLGAMAGAWLAARRRA
jgi:hypothetical protein